MPNAHVSCFGLGLVTLINSLTSRKNRGRYYPPRRAPGERSATMGDPFGDASLLETLRHSSTDGFFLIEGHLRRLRASAAVLGGGRRVPDPETLCQALEAEARHWPTGEASRVRLLLAPSGELRVERVALPGGLAHPEIGRLSAAAPVLVRLDSEAVPRADPTLRHKSTARGQYDAARTRAGVGEGGVFDVLMHNAEGELTECSIANVAVETEAGDWRTPPVACGLLAGVMREALLARGSSPGEGALTEGVVTLAELHEALRAGRRLMGFNSVRGLPCFIPRGGCRAELCFIPAARDSP